jgi:hypothetical protein
LLYLIYLEENLYRFQLILNKQLLLNNNRFSYKNGHLYLLTKVGLYHQYYHINLPCFFSQFFLILGMELLLIKILLLEDEEIFFQ